MSEINMNVDPGDSSPEKITDLFVSLDGLYRACGGERIKFTGKSNQVKMNLDGPARAAARVTIILEKCFSHAHEYADSVESQRLLRQEWDDRE